MKRKMSGPRTLRKLRAQRKAELSHFQISPDLCERLAPTNLTSRIKVSSRFVGREAVLHDAQFRIVNVVRNDGEVGSELAPKRQRSRLPSLALRALEGIIDPACLAFHRRFDAGKQRAVRFQSIDYALRKVVRGIFENGFFVLKLHEFE